MSKKNHNPPEKSLTLISSSEKFGGMKRKSEKDPDGFRG